MCFSVNLPPQTVLALQFLLPWRQTCRVTSAYVHKPHLQAHFHISDIYDCIRLDVLLFPPTEDQAGFWHKPGTVQDSPADFRGREGNARWTMAQSWSYAGSNVAEKVWQPGVSGWVCSFDVSFLNHCTPPLTRSLRFIQVFLQSLANGEKDEANPNLIRVNLSKAYEVALKRYHGWLVQQLFKVSSGFRLPAADTELTPVFAPQAALFTAPYKSDFLRALSKGRDVKEEDCLEKIRKFLVNFTATVDVIYEMYGKMNPDLENRVWREDAHSCSGSLSISPLAACS